MSGAQGVLAIEPEKSLSKEDASYRPHSWQELRQLVSSNNLADLQRWPSDRERYLLWAAETREQYGSVINFVIQKRLAWPISEDNTRAADDSLFDLDSPVPFQSKKDWKVLLNDWPYGFEPGITHIIVWLKHRLETQPPVGDLAPGARAQVLGFIDRVFQRDVDTLGGTRDRVIWFKNWTALQTVPGIDHIHVLVRDIPESMLQKWLSN